MKKIIAIILLTFSICMYFCGCGCSQVMTKNYGGEMTINLPKGEKLEEITWKDDDLWYLTRPFREDEEPEIHKFQENSVYGI